MTPDLPARSTPTLTLTEHVFSLSRALCGRFPPRQCGIADPTVCARYFKALDKAGREALSFNEFLIGMVAMDPNTTNAGAWRHLRADFIFRVYDTDDDGNLYVVSLTCSCGGEQDTANL